MRSPGFNPHSSAGLSERETRSVAGNHTSVKSEQKKKKNLAERSRLNEEGKKSEQTAVTWRGGDSWPHCRLFAKPISRSGERRYIRKQCCQNNNSTKKNPRVESVLLANASSSVADRLYFISYFTDSGSGASGPLCTLPGHETDSETPRVRGSSR